MGSLTERIGSRAVGVIVIVVGAFVAILLVAILVNSAGLLLNPPPAPK